jgi:hypothetical protein
MHTQAYRDDLSHLVVMEAPLPGTAVFEDTRSDPSVWHFSFRNVRDIPEMLVAGRERRYLQHMIKERIFDPSSITDDDLDVYASAYAAPGAMRAGFELYRAFDQDAEDNPRRPAAKREADRAGPRCRRGRERRINRRTDDARGGRDRDRDGRAASGPLDPEEAPEAFTVALLKFLS